MESIIVIIFYNKVRVLNIMNLQNVQMLLNNVNIRNLRSDYYAQHYNSI